MRGLSDVTMTMSLSRAATMPIKRTLGAIAIAAAAEHGDQSLVRQRARGFQQVPQRIVGVRVIDDDGEVVLGDDTTSKRPGTPGSASTPRAIVSSGMSSATAVAVAARML